MRLTQRARRLLLAAFVALLAWLAARLRRFVQEVKAGRARQWLRDRSSPAWAVLDVLARPGIACLTPVLDQFADPVITHIHGPGLYGELLPNCPGWLRRTWVRERIFAVLPFTRAPDEVVPYLKDVRYTPDVRYSEGPRRTLEVMLPMQERGLPCVLYVHGGGFVATTPRHYMQSFTPLVRAGFPVYAADYPRSPGHKFPTAALAILEALCWLKQQGKSRVLVVGDSAGACLAMTAVALVENPDLRERVAPGVEFNLPTVLACASIYGMLERDQFVDVPKDWELSNASHWAMVFGVEIAWRCYCGTGKGGPLPAAFCDLLPLVTKFPPCMLIAGTLDPLITCSRVCHRQLQAKGFSSKLLEYRAPHAFHGVPKDWLGPFAQANGDASEELTAFFLHHAAQEGLSPTHN